MYKLVLTFILAFWTLNVSAQAALPEKNGSSSQIQSEFNSADFEQQMAEADVAMIEALLKENFDFNRKDSTGNPPLYYALTRNPNLEVAKKMISFGADVNAPASNGMIPLNIATSKANELQLQIMMMRTLGLDISNPEIQDELKKNLFHEMNRVIDMTRLLIENGADVNRESSLGTPLMNAVTNAWNQEIVEMLIKAGAHLNQTDKDGKTALFYAAASGNDDIVAMLLKAGANPDIKDKDGKLFSDMEKLNVGSPLND